MNEIAGVNCGRMPNKCQLGKHHITLAVSYLSFFLP